MASANASRYVYEPGQLFTCTAFYLQRLRCAPPEIARAWRKNQIGTVEGGICGALLMRASGQ